MSLYIWSHNLSSGILKAMPRQEKVEALVLSRRNIGEADRLVTFFTWQRGLMRVVAKGVRRIPSRRGGHLEPITKVIATVGGSPERSYLATIETSDYLSILHNNREALAAAHVVGSAAVHLFEYGTPYPKVFEAMGYAWENFARYRLPRRHLLEAAVLMLMLREAGVMPGIGELAEAGVSLSGRAYALWQHVCAEPRQALVAEAKDESDEVAQAVRQYLAYAFPLRAAPHQPAGAVY